MRVFMTLISALCNVCRRSKDKRRQQRLLTRSPMSMGPGSGNMHQDLRHGVARQVMYAAVGFVQQVSFVAISHSLYCLCI